ncbi:uncharacterized protein LOC121371765 [Gigantopelta aegis]|uniref:uncharacterized protein LOC121371765 n=1 Tax=Gigantopelta aegis TaxID=1735272 RepID=UPI001B88D8D7|nr:uncharacterized protein LOC121371765 [Gigantopelta aegis]
MAVANKNHLIATGIMCGIVLVCGVACSVLLYESLKVTEKYVMETVDVSLDDPDLKENYEHAFSRISGPVWLFGLVYAIPGLLGLIGCCLKSKCMFVTHMVFSILSLLVMGLVFVGCIIFIGASASNGGMQCVNVNGQCMCKTTNAFSSREVNIGIGDCDIFNEMYGLIVALAVVICVGWIVELIATIMAGKYACCSSEVNHPGVIMQHGPTMTHVHVSSVVTDQHPGSDRSILVQNMQY